MLREAGAYDLLFRADFLASLPEADLASARKFESEIGDLLKTLGLKHVGSGQGNVLGGVQIDASGGIGDCFIAVECHTSIEARRRSVRAKIKEHRGIVQQIREGLSEERWGRKFRKIRLVLATRNIEIPAPDRRFAAQRPKVYLWDDSFRSYYNQEIQKIGKYSIKEILGELDVTFPPKIVENEHCLPAFRSRIRGKTIYSFLAKPGVILDIAFVARRERGTERYYQRFLKKDRIEEIGKFLRDRRSRNFFANNLILSFQRPVRFIPRRGFGSPDGIQVGWLYLPKQPRSAWIIDGQHRLYGFTKAPAALREVRVPVVAFADLDEDRQAEFFLTINKEQKPVDPNLLWDLEGEIHPNSEVGVISRVVKRLDEREPFESKVFIPRKGGNRKGRHIYLANFCDSIQSRELTSRSTENMPANRRNPLYRSASTQQVEVLSRALSGYFHEISRVFAKNWNLGKKGFFFTNNGLNVMLRVYEQILAYLGHNPRGKELRKFLRPLKAHFNSRYSTHDAVNELRSACNGEGGRLQTTLEFLGVIQQSFPGFATGVAAGRSPRDVIAAFEERMKVAVADAISAFDPGWWTNAARVPPHIRTRAEGRCRAEGGTNPAMFLDLGELDELVRLGDNWRDVFAPRLRRVFRNQTRFSGHFQELVEYRNALMHAAGHLEPHQQELFRIYLGEMRRAFHIRETS